MIGVVAAGTGARIITGSHAARRLVHFADADDAAIVTAGAGLYAARCAACHGRHREGQPLWQLADRDSWRRAPAHDWTGHTWLHGDEDLFHVTKYGRFDYAPPNAPSAMPAFATTLSDGEILSVLAFIKSRWPDNLRAAQASLNPGGAGSPSSLASAAWTFRSLCTPRKPSN
jgi:mono/diheme cytochrome c family protein